VEDERNPGDMLLQGALTYKLDNVVAPEWSILSCAAKAARKKIVHFMNDMFMYLVPPIKSSTSHRVVVVGQCSPNAGFWGTTTDHEHFCLATAPCHDFSDKVIHLRTRVLKCAVKLRQCLVLSTELLSAMMWRFERVMRMLFAVATYAIATCLSI